MTAPIDSREPAEHDARGEILSLHLGPSANCSSIGSFVDFLFLSSVAGGALIAALAATMEARRAAPGDVDEEE